MSAVAAADDASGFYAGSDLEALADLARYQDWILRDFRPHLAGRVLEVGAGIGNLARRYAGQVREAVLLEPAANLLPALRARFAGQAHVTVAGGTVESWLAARGPAGPGAPFDAVLMVNVLEHIRDDVGTLRALAGLLRPGGAMLLFVPACPWLYGSLDALVAHVRRYDRAGLADVVTAAGLDVAALRYFDLPGVLPWWLAGRVFKRRRFDAGAARAYDRVVVPVAAAAERRFAPPIGKNLVCVARRPARAAGGTP